jgi:hypothetical protein
MALLSSELDFFLFPWRAELWWIDGEDGDEEAADMLDCVVVVDVFDNVAYMLKNPINRSNMSRVKAYDTVDVSSIVKKPEITLSRNFCPQVCGLVSDVSLRVTAYGTKLTESNTKGANKVCCGRNT